MSSSKGWFNLESAAGTIPETQFFEGDSAFKALGLTRTQRLYGFAGWCVLAVVHARFVAWATSQLANHCARTSLALGFVLSILGAALLFLGQLGSFASEYCLRMWAWSVLRMDSLVTGYSRFHILSSIAIINAT